MKKRLISIAMCAALAAVPVQTWAGETEAETFSFEQLADQVFYYSSGAGGWGVELIIAGDGSFTGNYHDSEMGSTGEGYPNGTVYECIYHGQLASQEKDSDYSWKLTVESLETEDVEGEEEIKDDIRFVKSAPVGLKEGDELVLYLPGYPVKDIPEEFASWAHLYFYDPQPEELPFYGIYDAAEDSGFVGDDKSELADSETEAEAVTEAAMTGLANPWVETDEKGFSQKVGIELKVPDGAKDVTYSVMEDSGLGEMRFQWNNAACTARVKSSGFGEDISGLNYDKWDSSEECKIKHCEGTVKSVKDESLGLVIQNCQWFDMVPGIMYSLTAEAEDLDGFDIKAIAEQVYVPAQGDS